MTVLERLNELRARSGLPGLTHDPRLADAALAQARFLASGAADLNDSHTGAGGSNIHDRIMAAGYRPRRWREITGWGWGGDEEQMLRYWLDSPVHHDAICASDVTQAGVAYLYRAGSEWGHYWVVVFAAPVRESYTSYAPVVAAGPTAIDLLPYLRGDGRTYRVGNSRGGYEVFQTQAEGDRFYQVKAWDDLSVVNWEEFIVGDEYIRRDVDTSPGGGLFYRQFGAPWVYRHMWPGRTCTQSKRVQFYRLDSCVPVEQYSGDVIDRIRMVAYHERYTFPTNGWEPVTLENVVQLRWVDGGEDYWYARGYGLVAWGRSHQDANSPAWSAICEERWDMGPLQRVRVDCM